MSVKIALLPTRPLNPQQEVSRHIQSASEPIRFPPLFKTSNISCRGQRGNKEVLALKKKKSLMSKYVYPQQERAVHLFSILSDLPPSFFLSPSLFGEKEDRREERSSLSLRPECLAVFKWRTRTCFCLPRQIHCGGRWASTHTHILT